MSVSFLSKKHGTLFLEILRQNKMFPAFYDDLEIKIKSQEDCVRDIIKMLERENSNSITDTHIKHELINKYLIHILESSLTRGLTKMSRIHTFTNEEILSISPDNFSEHDSFLIIGCPESTDIDVICFVRDKDRYMGKTKELSNYSIKCIKQDLMSLGYDIVNRDIDINAVYVDPTTRTITASSKGGTETQNIINATWMFHKQIMVDSSQNIPLALKLHSVIDIIFTDEEIFEKLRALAKYILDYAEDICPNYKSFRPIKTEIYAQGGDCMMRFMKNILNHIVYTLDDVTKHNMDPVKFHDRFKAIIMKLLQIILHYHHKKTIYVKRELAKAVNDIFRNSEQSIIKEYELGSLWYLFRGKCGSFCPTLFPILLTMYCDIIDDFLKRTEVEPIVFTWEQIIAVKEQHDIIPCLNLNMLKMFFDSPKICTDEFEKAWIDLYDDQPINALFQIAASDEKEFYHNLEGFSNDVIQIFKRCFIFINQRSSEWLDMLSNKFICGNNSANISTSFQGKYNLIRGSIIELLVMHLFDPAIHGFNTFTKSFLGFVVESNCKNSKGFAPDLLLISTKESGIPELIFVEIKGLETLRKNSDYYRGLHLATKQVASGKNILSQFISQDKLIIKRGLILLCCIEDHLVKIEVHHVTL